MQPDKKAKEMADHLVKQHLEDTSTVTFGISDNDPHGQRGGTEYYIKMKFRGADTDKVRKILDYIDSTIVHTER